MGWPANCPLLHGINGLRGLRRCGSPLGTTPRHDLALDHDFLFLHDRSRQGIASGRARDEAEGPAQNPADDSARRRPERRAHGLGARRRGPSETHDEAEDEERQKGAQHAGHASVLARESYSPSDESWFAGAYRRSA
jgi:hypothetical protein